MPKISVIMATYNCATTLPRSLDSILAQSYADWEFVVCDDCSSDASWEILLEYQKRCPEKFVLLKNEQNSKLAFSLNRCLKVSQGEYIARMDGDDEACPERFAKQVAFLDTHPEYAVVGTAMIPFDETGDKPVRLPKEIPGPRDLVSRSPIFHATIMMRKSVYDALGGYYVSKRTQRAQDYDLWFRFFAKGFQAYSLQEGLYRVREDGQAIRRRTFSSRCYEVVTKLKGYRLLHYPWYLYLHAFKPIFVALMPVGLIQWYHAWSDAKSGNSDHTIS